MRCEICRKDISEIFLKKINGTYIKDDKGKLHAVCFECQKKFSSKKELLKNIR